MKQFSRTSVNTTEAQRIRGMGGGGAAPLGSTCQQVILSCIKSLSITQYSDGRAHVKSETKRPYTLCRKENYISNYWSRLFPLSIFPAEHATRTRSCLACVHMVVMFMLYLCWRMVSSLFYAAPGFATIYLLPKTFGLGILRSSCIRVTVLNTPDCCLST